MLSFFPNLLWLKQYKNVIYMSKIGVFMLAFWKPCDPRHKMDAVNSCARLSRRSRRSKHSRSDQAPGFPVGDSILNPARLWYLLLFFLSVFPELYVLIKIPLKGSRMHCPEHWTWSLKTGYCILLCHLMALELGKDSKLSASVFSSTRYRYLCHQRITTF